MKRKTFAFLLAFAAVLGLCLSGCGSEETKPASAVSADTEASKNETSSEITFAETVIYDENGIKVTATGLTDGIGEWTINLSLENNSDRHILINDADLSVNDYMMSNAALYCEIAAGKAASDTIHIYDSDLAEAGIDTIANISFYLRISDQETWDTLYTSDLISLDTSAADSFEQSVDDSGEVLYDSNGIRVICKGLKEDAIWDSNVVFYIENNSDKAISVCTENTSVNGMMEDTTFWTDLRPGTRAIDSMTMLDLSDLELDSIDDIFEVEFTLRILDEDTLEELAVSDVITLNFDE